MGIALWIAIGVAIFCSIVATNKKTRNKIILIIIKLEI